MPLQINRATHALKIRLNEVSETEIFFFSEAESRNMFVRVHFTLPLTFASSMTDLCSNPASAPLETPTRADKSSDFLCSTSCALKPLVTAPVTCPFDGAVLLALPLFSLALLCLRDALAQENPE